MSILKYFGSVSPVPGRSSVRPAKPDMKRGFILALAIFAAVSPAWGQSSQSGNDDERSVEESYLQDSVAIAIIREQSRSDNWEGQMLALEYISEAIDSGNTNDEIRGALEYIGLEGVGNVIRENGRIINNFPDIRARAAGFLGNMGTPEAKNSLIKMLLSDNEPWVLSETIKSLAKIGINDDEETVRTIAWIVRRYDTIAPNDVLAKSALDAFDSFAQSNDGIKDPSAIDAIMRIQNGRYIRQVQTRAKDVLANIRKHSQR